MIEERRALAKSVKSYRTAHQLTQMEFAEECGISDVELCHIERQNSNVSLETMRLLAARIGASVADLLTEEDRTSYCLIPTSVCINDKNVITYGIGVLQGNVMTDYVVDISDDYNKILSLVERCNEGKLDPIHLQDIAENALYD